MTRVDIIYINTHTYVHTHTYTYIHTHAHVFSVDRCGPVFAVPVSAGRSVSPESSG